VIRVAEQIVMTTREPHVNDVAVLRTEASETSQRITLPQKICDQN
jgi:hypothetical protein